MSTAGESARPVPWVTGSIIALCCAVFAWELATRDAVSRLASLWLIPSEFLGRGADTQFLDPTLYLPFLTATFLHADIVHVLLNMLFLAAFGGAIEQRLGRLRFAAFFLAGGMVASAAHVAAHPQSSEPVVGASGAIAAVMGCFFVLHPWQRVTLIWPDRIPAAVFLVLWLGVQIAQASDVLAPDAANGTAWWAHSMGFVYGACLASHLRLRGRPSRRRARTPAPRRRARAAQRKPRRTPRQRDPVL
jgi:membrane associated rhomboid family serine protease